MKEHNVSSYEDLETRTKAITGKCDSLLTSVKEDEKRLREIAVLKKHIVNYAKSKDVYAEYKKSGYSRQYFEEHRDLLAPRKAARQAFDEYKAAHDGAQLPKVKDLSAEYSAILTRKKQNYAEYRKLKSEMHDWQVALCIVQTIQNGDTPEQDAQRPNRGQGRDSE